MLFSPSRGTTLTTSVFIATIGLLIFFSLIKHVKRQRKLHQLSKSKGCQSPKHLPNSLLLPFGLDKYRAFAKAEKSNRLPILCLSEHEKHGDTYAQNAGGIYIMFTREPANLRAVLSTQFKDFELGDIRRGILFPLLGSGIFTNDSVQWEKSRKLLAPIFHKPNVPSLDVLELHTQNLIRRITSSKAVYNGDSSRVDIDLQPPILEFNLDTATHIFFGKSTSCLAGTSSGATADFPRPFNYALGYLARRERLRAFYWLLNGSKFRRSCKEAHENLEQIIKDSIQSFDWNGDHSTALQHIQEHIEDDASLRDEILNLLFAARDTSAAFLNWIFYTLAREPEVCRKVREEIQCVLENEAKAPNSEELAQMIYLDDVMNEVLRLFPVVPLNGRRCVRDTTLPTGGGPMGSAPIAVPAGTWLSYSVFALQLSSKIYGPNALAFRPERWKEVSARDRTIDWSWAPFNGGPRKCLGERYALKQAKYVTVRLLQSFQGIGVGGEKNGESEHGEGSMGNGPWYENVRYHVDFVMTPHGGNWVKLEL